ncbi:MAG: hypothetical protein KA215_03250 [Flavobacterium sp.]|nr:hypothetical protein [Flavobacterium sp.]
MRKSAFYSFLILSIYLNGLAQNNPQVKLHVRYEDFSNDSLKINLYTNDSNSRSLNDSLINFELFSVHNKIFSRVKIKKKNKETFSIYFPVNPDWLPKNKNYFSTGIAMEYNIKSGILKSIFPKDKAKIYTKKFNLYQACLDMLIYFYNFVLK